MLVEPVETSVTFIALRFDELNRRLALGCHTRDAGGI